MGVVVSQPFIGGTWWSEKVVGWRSRLDSLLYGWPPEWMRVTFFLQILIECLPGTLMVIIICVRLKESMRSEKDEGLR